MCNATITTEKTVRLTTQTTKYQHVKKEMDSPWQEEREERSGVRAINSPYLNIINEIIVDPGTSQALGYYMHGNTWAL